MNADERWFQGHLRELDESRSAGSCWSTARWAGSPTPTSAGP